MHQWKEVTLDEIADLTVGFVGKTATHYVGEGIRFLRSMNVEPFRINYNDPKFIDQEFHNKIKKSELNSGDVVIVRTGKPGACSVIPQKLGKWNCADLVVVKPNHECVNSTYLAAFINLAYGVINAHLVGAVQQHFNVGVAKKLKIKLPPMDLQNKIGYFIDNINDRIELNKNLEQQAQAIYQQMFIDNASSDWAEGTLSNIADITMGQSPSGSSYNEDGNGTIFFQGRAEFGFRFPTVRLYTTEPKRMACANDTLMSVRAPVGDLNVAHTDCCIGRGLAAIHSKNNHQSFVLYTMFSLKKQLDVFNGEGTVFGSINRSSLNEMPILIPSSEKLAEFEALVAPMDATIRSNYDEICRLDQLRDTLLPKFMSGELDVSDIDL